MVNVLGWRWRTFMIFAIALLLINLSGCTQVSRSLSQPHSTQGNRLLEFVPKYSIFATVVDATINPGKVWPRSNFAESFSSAATAIFSPLAIGFDEEILPWLGNNVVFAITDKDLDRDRRNGRQSGYLLAADVADSDRLREFLEFFWQRQSLAGRQTVLLNDSGIPIIFGAVGTQQLATALVGKSTFLVANDVRVLQQSLRAAQAPDLQLLGQSCCATVWMNLRLPEFLDWLGVAAPEKLSLLSAVRWRQLNTAAEFYPQQVVLTTALTRSDDGPVAEIIEPGPAVEANTLAQYVPESVAWVAMGHDLRPLWTELQNELAHYQQIPSVVQRWRQWLSTQLAQTLADPVTQLLSGDYAVGQLGDGAGLVIAREANPTVIAQLNSIAEQQGLTVSQFLLKGQLVTAWSRLKTRVDTRNRETTVETDLVGVHTEADGYHLFSTSIGGLTAALDAPGQNLSSDQQFQHAVRLMNTPNQGYVYGTWPDLERLLSSDRWFSLVNPVLQPWSQSIDAIALTSYGQTANQSTGTVSIQLKN
ncbi:MAG: DUF3352 domain-containing protein [Leptolyngbyaceae cyanobacterium]